MDLETFTEIYRQLDDLDMDIMLEVKDKEQSVLRLCERFSELRLKR